MAWTTIRHPIGAARALSLAAIAASATIAAGAATTSAAAQSAGAWVAPPQYLSMAALAFIILLVLLAGYAWLRRLRAERRVGLLDRLTQDLERRDAILGAVAYAATRFLEDDYLEDRLVGTLERLLRATAADSACVLRAPGGDPELAGPSPDDPGLRGIEITQCVPEVLPRESLRRFWREDRSGHGWQRALSEGAVVAAPAPGDQLPPAFRELGVASLLLVPVFAHRSWWGALAFHSHDPERRWSAPEIDALRAAGGIIGAAAARRAALAALTEREEQLRQAQKMEAIGRLAGGIAHDFNNLLTAMGGNAALLAEAVDIGDDHRTVAGEIVRGVERGSSLTKQLLAFSRRQALPSRSHDAAVAIHEMRPMLERLLGERIRLTTRASGPAWISIPPGQLEQVVLNLCVNARDAMPGGGQLGIDTRIEAAGARGEVVIEVTDTGAGMDAAVVARVFDPFFTTKDGGSGLGLSIVYGIITQAHGSVEIDSAPGRGTRVTLRFPAVPPPRATPREEIARAEGLGGDATVLLVEDEPAVRALARRVLAREGYRVLEAAHGDAALRLLDVREAGIDLLVTDVRMPGMSGAELAAEVGRRGYACPVLFMSGYAAEELALGEVPAERYLEKPFTPAQLVERTAALLNRPRATAG